MHERRNAWVASTTGTSAPHSSRPGAIATATDAPSPCEASTSAARSASKSPSCSTGSSTMSNPQSRSRGASSARPSSVSGEVQIQVLAPSRIRLLLPGPREPGHVLAPAQRVVQRRHVWLDVVVQVVVRDLGLRQDPLLRDLLALEDLQSGDDRRPPLVRRVRRRDRVPTLLLPLGEEVLLVLTGDGGTSTPASSNASLAA